MEDHWRLPHLPPKSLTNIASQGRRRTASAGFGDGSPDEAVLAKASRVAACLPPARSMEPRPCPPRSKLGKTLVVVATYNEIENLPLLVDDIFRYLPAADVLVVDDNSPDGTGRWCDAKAVDEPRLKCLHREGKLGLGTAVIAAMKYAIAQGYSYVLTMDADFSHPPKCLPAMVAGMDRQGRSVDVMIGSRYVPGGGIEGWPLKRHFMSRGVNFYSRWLLGSSHPGLQRQLSLLPQRGSRQARFRPHSQPRLFLDRRNPLVPEARRARFGETPIVFVDRQCGQSKINGKEAITALRIIFSLGMQSLFGY